MGNQWYKFYGAEFLSDPKIGALSSQERSCWITLMCLASSSSTQGVIEYLTIEVLLSKSGINYDPYSPNEWNNCLAVLDKFEKMKMIKKNENGMIELINWNKRQEKVMTATERSRKYRAKSKENYENETDATKQNESATLEENRKEKNRIEIQDSLKKVAKEIGENIEWLDVETWTKWVTYRKEAGKKLTPSSN
jgi:N-terminal phage replisome organiser (Phage_rep_org_N)